MSLLVHCWAHWSRAFQEASFPSSLEEKNRAYLLAVVHSTKRASLGCVIRAVSGTVQCSFVACAKLVCIDILELIHYQKPPCRHYEAIPPNYAEYVVLVPLSMKKHNNCRRYYT